ncbi:UNKNOWN [Stylonychia lemnae]|uniref:Transmembrane protein n=1 Tax=Stylonychia lemnae TaxID=5949 RepID=A0A078AZ49_STYLE|nr:UNKNOWN [Stylonychia lemnae]|eukprot:CDW87730.1 UNKNOWN [Stylonychia lemnae]
MEQSQFIGNVAQTGGAIYASSDSNVNSIAFLNDETIGSFIFLIFDVTMDIDNCQFRNGVSNLGGSIYISGDSVIRITNSMFINNQANSKGGAIYSSGFKSIFIGQGTQFINNSALDNGEDIYITNSFNILTLDNVVLSNLNSKNSIYIEQAILYAENMIIKDINQNKQSKRGAGLFCNYCKGLQIKSSQFINLKSSQGGAIYLIELDINKGTTLQQTDEKFLIQNSQFHNCTAEIGGAINADNPQSLKIINSTFIKNKAIIDNQSQFQIQNKGSGGAIYYTCNNQLLNCKMKLEDKNIFQDNSADLQGGAIFWDQLEPIFTKKEKFINNNAIKDDFQLRQLQNEQPSTQEIKSQRSGGTIPKLYMALKDQYGQIVGSDFKSKVRVSVDLKNLDNKQSLYLPILEGTLSFDIIGGIALIQDISIVGNPGSSYKFIITTDGIDLSKQSNQDRMQQSGNSDLDFNLKIELRECEIGEQFTSAGKCLKCEQSFSLVKMTSPGTCEICPTEKAICNGGAEIGPQPGFWRSSNQSIVFTQCLFEQACLGMISPQNNPKGECLQGYQGILCADCISGYSRDKEYQCAICPEPALNTLRLITIFIAVIIFVVLMIRSTLKSAQDINNVTSIYLKILLNHFQLILMTASFDFQWSEQIVGFFTTTKQVATQSTQIFSFDCFLDTGGETKALLPFMLTIACSLIWSIYKKIMKNLIEIGGKIMSSLVILLFLVHPSLVTFSFNDFKCKEVDGQLRVQDDLEIICWSPEHSFYSFFVALPCIIVWGLGIPFFALTILIRKRKKLDNFEIRQRYGFLYRGYRKEYYYWEIVIMYRKILIIFTAVFISNFGIIAQALIVFFTLIVFLLINFKKQPFNTLVLNDLETLSLITSMITIYCGLFFILNKPKTWIENNPDYSRGSVSLSTAIQRLFFALILISNLFFFIYWMFKIKGELKLNKNNIERLMISFSKEEVEKIAKTKQLESYEIELFEKEKKRKSFLQKEPDINNYEDSRDDLQNYLKLKEQNLIDNDQDITHYYEYYRDDESRIQTMQTEESQQDINFEISSTIARNKRLKQLQNNKKSYRNQHEIPLNQYLKKKFQKEQEQRKSRYKNQQRTYLSNYELIKENNKESSTSLNSNDRNMISSFNNKNASQSSLDNYSPNSGKSQNIHNKIKYSKSQFRKIQNLDQQLSIEVNSDDLTDDNLFSSQNQEEQKQDASLELQNVSSNFFTLVDRIDYEKEEINYDDGNILSFSNKEEQNNLLETMAFRLIPTQTFKVYDKKQEVQILTEVNANHKLDKLAKEEIYKAKETEINEMDLQLQDYTSDEEKKINLNKSSQYSKGFSSFNNHISGESPKILSSQKSDSKSLSEKNN